MRNNALKLTEAIKKLEKGSSLNSVSKDIGINVNTLSRYWHRYQELGEKAIIEKRTYSLDFKMKVIEEVKNKNQSVSFVANKYGLPSITVRRWLKAIEKGRDSLSDKRKLSDPVPNVNDDYTYTIHCIEKTVERIHSYEEKYYKNIYSTLVDTKAFDYPAFNSYLHEVYRSSKFVGEDIKGRRLPNYDDYLAICTDAKIMMQFKLYDPLLWHAAESLFKYPGVQGFVVQYLNTIFNNYVGNERG